METEEANEFAELIGEMAPANIINQFGSKLDAFRAELRAQNTKYDLLLWFIGVGVGLVIASNFAS
ncbi:MAG: hypothetical protein OXI05_08940 [Bacteroidota bacterium]|nr:hypothetical protein [Bacteroidota bacterium]MXW14054.1 hypothetical protein [Rhodothermaceae bacterium]MDE2645947.1 hypothetical protein [Bacteroidota bacterium]MXW32634.1 hypothetical protein [Rhodothermaceae bacterium]MXZ17243.1 hypothetical protein [Rhodothermaceae bacterium]